MQLWLSGSCSLLCRGRLRLWLWPVYCPLDFIAHFRVLVVARMWIWLWGIRSVLLIQAKKKLGPSAEFSILHIHFLCCSSELICVMTINQHTFNFSCFQWPFPLYKHTNHGNAPENPLASILLLPIATLLSFYV